MTRCGEGVCARHMLLLLLCADRVSWQNGALASAQQI